MLGINGMGTERGSKTCRYSGDRTIKSHDSRCKHECSITYGPQETELHEHKQNREPDADG